MARAKQAAKRNKVETSQPATVLQESIPNIPPPKPKVLEILTRQPGKLNEPTGHKWTDEEIGQTYQKFAQSYEAAYGHVMKLARAIVAGEVTDNQLRDFWAVNKEADNARRFLGALKAALASAQSLPSGDKNPDAFTYNVNPKTGVLSRDKVKNRKKTTSLKKLALRLSRIIKRDFPADSPNSKEKREQAVKMFTSAILDAEMFADEHG